MWSKVLSTKGIIILLLGFEKREAQMQSRLLGGGRRPCPVSGGSLV